jgi:hypothetical protein
VLLSRDSLVGSANNALDEAYLVDMHPGLTRDQATRALTQGVIFSGGPAPGEADIVGTAISADGNTVALATQRTRFDLASPSYVGPPRPAKADGNELYVLDRSRNTLELVTGGYDGSFAHYPNVCGGTLSPSLSADGSLAAFDSCADNLVFGDGNNASDVFVSSRLRAAARLSPHQRSAPLPPLIAITPLWVLRATARRHADGSVELNILVPSRGRVSVLASSRIQAPPLRGRHAPRMLVRTVAAAHTSPPAGGLITLKLHLSLAYAALARRTSGLAATVRLAFSAPGLGAPLHDAIAVTFRLPKPRTSSKPHSHPRPARRR